MTSDQVSNLKHDSEDMMDVDEGNEESKVFFWEKWASFSDEKEDKPIFYEVASDPRIREVIRNFESRIIGKKVLFSDISTKNPSIKKWINKIIDSYPQPENETVEDLLNAFRDSLRTTSKEKHKYIVGVLLLEDLMLLLHSKKESSLAEVNDELYPVDVVLNPKNVLRTAILKKENGKTTFSVFEYSRSLRKGHAEFWGIDPEDVSWESLGNIILEIELGDFRLPIQLPIDSEQLDEMISQQEIRSRGQIRLGRGVEGTITKVVIIRKYMDFSEFYDFYITRKEDLEEYRKKFKQILKATIDDYYDYDDPSLVKYKYEDDINKLFEIKSENKVILEKNHLRYHICFFTKTHPRITPSKKFLNVLYESVFENKGIEIWHAGEETSDEPLKIGSLSIYNHIDVNRDIIQFSDNLLDLIQDARGKKETMLLQNTFCNFWKFNLTSNKHLGCLFDFMMDSIINKDLNFEFENAGILSKENCLEFKSADTVDAKPSRFADTLVKTVRSYVNGNNLERLCIIYGIEDNGVMNPIYNRLKNDQATFVEKKANELLKDDGIQLIIQPIPFNTGVIPAVYIIPTSSFLTS